MYTQKSQGRECLCHDFSHERLKGRSCSKTKGVYSEHKGTEHGNELDHKGSNEEDWKLGMAQGIGIGKFDVNDWTGKHKTGKHIYTYKRDVTRGSRE